MIKVLLRGELLLLGWHLMGSRRMHVMDSISQTEAALSRMHHGLLIAMDCCGRMWLLGLYHFHIIIHNINTAPFLNDLLNLLGLRRRVLSIIILI